MELLTQQQNCLWDFLSCIGWDLRESLGWSEQISPGQCRFSFGHVRGELNKRKMVPACRHHRRRAQQRDSGGCPCSLCSAAMQLSLFLYVFSTSQASGFAFFQSSGWVPASKQVCAWIFYREVWIFSCLPSPLDGQRPHWFLQPDFMGNHLSGIGNLGWEVFVLGLGPSFFQGNLRIWDVPPIAQPSHVALRQACLCLCHLYQSWYGFLFISPVIRVLFR